MTPAQLERLLELLEALPPATQPLDEERAEALGVSTDPDEAFAVSVEAIFVNEDFDAIEALLEVIADVTNTPVAPLLKAVTEKPQVEVEVDEEHAYDVPEGFEEELPPGVDEKDQPPIYGSPEWKKHHAKLVKEFEERLKHPEREEWITGPFERKGLHRFVHIGRAPNDPERAPRVKGADTTAWRKKLLGKDLEPWKKLLYDTLKKEGPMTFNKLALLTSGYTADIALDKAPDKALWELVDEEKVELTNMSPTIFRVREKKPGKFGKKEQKGETIGQYYDTLSPADKKRWWDDAVKYARETRKLKWPKDVWGNDIKSSEQFGKSLYRPGMKWPRKK